MYGKPENDSDESVLQDIVNLMSKMNGESVGSVRAEMKKEEIPGQDTQKTLKVLELPGEGPAQMPESDEVMDKEALDGGPEMGSMVDKGISVEEGEENGEDDEDDRGSDRGLRRMAKIF